MTTGTIVIKRGREKPIIQQHPWIFSGAIQEVKGDPAPGDIVTVTDSKGRFLARGYWNPKSQIQVRILTWHDEPIDDDWWRRMLKRAMDARSGFAHLLPSSGRLINAENDFLPGLIVDKYENWIVMQCLTLGIDKQKNLLAQILADYLIPQGIYERSDVDVRRKEGLNEQTGVLWGEEPPNTIEISEGQYKLLVDLKRGHKTGFYLDQKDNRHLAYSLVVSYVGRSENCRFLNLFSYTGGFGLSALQGEASSHISVTNVDVSMEALELAESSAQLNDPNWLNSIEFIQADVFDYLRDQVAEGNQWDIVVLDPPKFAQNAKQVEGAARGYKDINLNAFKCVKPGGYLMTFSCSGAISADLFQKIVFGALADSGRQAQILKHLGPGDDHPVALTFPEGAYLKGLLLRVY
jgi:23S rRNA (cytosine1962-C5)-methyltransferase